MLFKRVYGPWHIIILYLCLVFPAIGCDTGSHDAGQLDVQKNAGRGYSRILSLSPGITETLYALGLGDNIVGVTRFCSFPPEAAGKPSVGGYLDPNYEMMVRLEPDLVLLLPEHEEVRSYLDQLDIRHETVRNRTVEDIMATIEIIGNLCGAESRADSLVRGIRRRIDTVQNNIPAGRRPRVLVSIGRTLGTGTLKDVYVAGSGTSYDELIDLAGGVNAYSGDGIAYPLLSAEGLLHLNPDIIIDLVPDLDEKGYDREAILDEWRIVGNVNAVRNSSIHLLTGDYTVIPGPRFILLLEDMADIIQTDTETQ